MKCKNAVTKIICIVICCICCISSVCANDIITSDYFHFLKNNTRMNSDGSFEFAMVISVTSDVFTAQKAYVTIGTTAHVYDRSNRTEFDSSNEDYEYKVSLYKNNFTHTYVGGYYALSDGTRYGQSYSVDKNEEYYIVLTSTNRNLKLTQYNIEGTGNISNVTVN